MTAEAILGALLRYAEEAGRIALAEQSGLSATVKPDDTYVTEVDLRLSRLAVSMLSEVVPPESIVTEEHLEHLHRDEATQGGDTPEILVFVDPIDGTRNYFHNIPLYGISVGVFKDRKPWLGVVAFPGLGELIYSDETGAYLEQNAFGSDSSIMRLEPEAADLNENSVILLANSYVREYRWSYRVCTSLVTACVALNACWPLLNRGVGTVLLDHIWDFAGSWPILEKLRFELRGAKSGAVMDCYRPEDYDPDTLMLKEPVIVCRPEHYERLRDGMVPGSAVE